MTGSVYSEQPRAIRSAFLKAGHLIPIESLHVLSNLTPTVLPDHRSEDWEQPWSEGADSKVAML